MSMILYNIRHRGPYEYDKFILNVFQLYNEIKRLNKQVTNNEINNLKEKEKNLNQVFNSLTNEKSFLYDLLYYKTKVGL